MGNSCITCGKLLKNRQPCSDCAKSEPKPATCGNTPQVLEVDNTQLVLFRKVLVPASLGTEEEYPIPVGLRNVLLCYEANSHVYLIDTGGIATRFPDNDTPALIAALRADLTTETATRAAADTTLQNNIDAETSARQAADEAIAGDLADEIGNRETADLALQDNIDAEATARAAADTTLQSNIDDVTALIPNQASAQNQLADKAFVNSTVQTDTANYRGSWANWTVVPTDATAYPTDFAGGTTPTVNDYMVVQDASDYTSTLEGTWRFKYTGDWDTDGKAGWIPEYQVNESPFSAAQVAAIDSGITAALVSKLTGLQSITAIGTALDLTNGTLSATEMTGATGATAGTAGIVPAPGAGYQNTFLRGDGTWVALGSGSGTLSDTTVFWGQTAVNGVVNGEIIGDGSDSLKMTSGGTLGISFRVGASGSATERFNINPTQMNAYQPLNMNSNKITGVADGSVNTDAVNYGQLTTGLNAKQNTLTFDTTPTANSTKPVTSGGVYTYVNTELGDIETLLAAI